MAADLPRALIRLLRTCVPTYPAAEFLLFIAAHADHARTPEEFVHAMRPAVIALPAVSEYLTLFKTRGVVTENQGRYIYGPNSAEIDQGIKELARAYNERPVTLIAAIVHISDSKIESFADSFRLTEDEEE